jgi:hypothetical protein
VVLEVVVHQDIVVEGLIAEVEIVSQVEAQEEAQEEQL